MAVRCAASTVDAFEAVQPGSLARDHVAAADAPWAFVDAVAAATLEAAAAGGLTGLRRGFAQSGKQSGSRALLPIQRLRLQAQRLSHWNEPCTLVILGLAFIESLAIYALDAGGCGRSTRPQLPSSRWLRGCDCGSTASDSNRSAARDTHVPDRPEMY